MSNNGTGFWVVVALIAALSVAAIIQAAMGLASRKIKRWLTVATPFSRGCNTEEAST